MDPAQTDQMIVLLDAQRREALHRAGRIRDSPGWVESSARLAAINDQIMHLGALGPIGTDPAARPSVGDAPPP